MELQHKNGENKGKVVLYALSTCVWCRKTKRLFEKLGIAYDFVDVDLLDGAEKEQAKEEIMKWNPRCSFPTIVLNDDKCVIGYDEMKIREILGITD
jgi:glutaredoxin-like protein NrdH